MEYEHRLYRWISTSGRDGECCVRTKEDLLDSRGGVDVNRSWYMAAFILVIKAAVDNAVVGYLPVIFAIEKVVQLAGKLA